MIWYVHKKLNNAGLGQYVIDHNCECNNTGKVVYFGNKQSCLHWVKHEMQIESEVNDE